MQLYLLRHGIAEDSAPSDALRKLTPEGRRKLKTVLQTAAASGITPAVILSSPLVRARQTAEVAAEVLGYKGDIIETAALLPDAQASSVWSEIRTWQKDGDILASSHNPLCAQAAGYLLGQPGLPVHFTKAGLMCMEFESLGMAPRGILRWFLTPKLAGA